MNLSLTKPYMMTTLTCIILLPVLAACQNFDCREKRITSTSALVKCLQYEERDPEADLINRRRIIFKLHKSGNEAIPFLISNISNEKRITAMLDDPRSCGAGEMYVNVGLLSAYLVELILGKENLIPQKGFSVSILGLSPENYIYSNGNIRNSKKEFITKDDLRDIQIIYQHWWEVNQHEPIEVLRKKWKKGERALDGKQYRWS